MFELSADESAALRSQIATIEPGRGNYSKYQPYAFTEQGVAMLSSVLYSPRAVRVNIEINDGSPTPNSNARKRAKRER